jgi:hypothetical protein
VIDETIGDRILRLKANMERKGIPFNMETLRRELAIDNRRRSLGLTVISGGRP